MVSTRNFLGKWAVTVLFEMRWRTLTENGSRRSRNPPRRAHGTLQPLAESVIVGYYTSAEVHLPGLPVSAAQWARKERYGKRRRIDRTSARNMRLTTQKLKNAQQHNEREKDSYVNPDIVPECSHLNIHFKKPDGSYLEQFERMEADSVISTRGLKEDAFRYGELVFDVNSAYFFNRGGYEFAKRVLRGRLSSCGSDCRWGTVYPVRGHARR